MSRHVFNIAFQQRSSAGMPDAGFRDVPGARSYHMRGVLPVLFVFLFSFYFAAAQDSPSVKLTIDKNEIVVGEQLRMTMDIRYPTGLIMQVLPVDSIPHFALIGKAATDSLIAGNTSVYHLTWKLTSFDSGVNLIPPIPVVIGGRHFQTDSLRVTVGFGNLDSLKEYHDIRGIVDKDNPAVKYIVWVVLGLTLLGIVLFLLFINRQAIVPAQRERESRKSRLSNAEEALAALDALKKMPLTDLASVKKYYSEMNDVLRVFLSRHLHLPAMVRTNEELILPLSSLDMNKDSFFRLAGTLRMSDFVKFARYMPDAPDNEKNLEIIRTAIIQINEMRN